jgi:long-chain fatty acid transport protein
MQLGWSSYDVLTLEFADPVAGETSVSDDKKFEDSYSLRFGLEYRLNDSWALRGGYLRDNKAVPDTHLEPTLPENARNLYSVGVGWNSNSLTVDAFFMLLTQDDREITTSTKTIMIDETEVAFNGKYEGSALLFGVTLGYALD